MRVPRRLHGCVCRYVVYVRLPFSVSRVCDGSRLGQGILDLQWTSYVWMLKIEGDRESRFRTPHPPFQLVVAVGYLGFVEGYMVATWR